MGKRIWDKGEVVDQLMHELTVGNDPELDRNLVSADAFGSAAHARMLRKVGLLTSDDCRVLLKELSEIAALGSKGLFPIPRELEDVHSAIESRLIEKCGEAGRRIHTARSRNDQVLLATRLFIRRKVLSDLEVCFSLADTIATRFSELCDVQMPGYTHMQPAMPSSFGMWLHSWYEGLLELMRCGISLLKELDSNPLGSGAGFGSSLRIDRAYVAELLGFARVQRSFIDVNNSRGRYETRYCSWACELASLFEKFASDVMLYTTREFGFIELPNELTTGSSIMPQKRNPDVVELLRARASKVRGAQWELQSLTAKLPSSYNRDLQYTKAPFFRASEELTSILQMAGLIFARFSVRRERVSDCLHEELYATYDACREVTKGQPFRDAYRATAERVKSGKLDISELKKDFELPQQETKDGMKDAQKECGLLKSEFMRGLELVNQAEAKVFDLE